MQKIFFNLKKYHNKVAFIDNDLKKYNYSFITDFIKKFESCIHRRGLILMIGSNQAGSVVGYISFLRLNYVLILLDESFSDQYIKKLIKIYKPEFIYGEDQRLQQFNLKDQKLKCLNFCLFKTKYRKNNYINKKNLLLISTSGSTNSPKFVRLSQINLIDNTKKIIDYLKINSAHKTITTMPFGYSYGLSIINSHLESGATILLNKKSVFESDFWKLVKKYKVNSFGGVPSFYELLKKLRFDKTFSPHIKYLTQAGGKLSDELILYYSNIKNIKFYQMYGQAEASPRIAYLEPKKNLQKLGSIGKPLKGYKLTIKKNPLSKKENLNGEFILHGKNVCLGYAKKKEDLKKGDENRGKISTGDLGYKDNEGYYYITGRKKRISKIFGLRVNLDDIELFLKKYNFSSKCITSNNSLNIEIKENFDENKLKKIIHSNFGIKLNYIKFYKVEKFSITNTFK